MTDVIEGAPGTPDVAPDIDRGEEALVAVGRLPDTRLIEFLNHEAALADSHAYAQWLELWSKDEGMYWVCGPGACETLDDAYTHASVIFDNRPRLENRVKQLLTNKRWSQIPRSDLVRLFANHRVVSPVDAPEIECWVNWTLAEYRNESFRMWAGRTLYRLREFAGDFQILEKRVVLANRAGPIETFGFLL